MAKAIKVEVRLSQFAQEFMAASLDLLQEVLGADQVLVTDEIREAADRLAAVIDGGRGEL